MNQTAKTTITKLRPDIILIDTTLFNSQRSVIIYIRQSRMVRHHYARSSIPTTRALRQHRIPSPSRDDGPRTSLARPRGRPPTPSINAENIAVACETHSIPFMVRLFVETVSNAVCVEAPICTQEG